jgi:NADH-quinone oxidoreductase subunit G
MEVKASVWRLTGVGPGVYQLLLMTGHNRKPNNGLIAVWPRSNDQGAWELGFRPLKDLKDAFQQFEAVYIAAADPVGDEPALAEVVKEAGFVVVQDLFLTDTAKLADVVLPAQPFTEREGTLTSGERRVQRFYPVYLRPELKPDYAITANIGTRVGLTMENAPVSIFNRLATKFPAFNGMSYRLLAQVNEQWPIVGRGDLYFGGTSYDNKQGLGVQLELPAHSPALAWPDIPELSVPDDAILAVPINRLYDRGQTMLSSQFLLKDRTPPAYIAVTDTAGRLNIRMGAGEYCV